MGILEEEERSIFKTRIAENFPNLRKELDIQVHVFAYYFNAKISSPRHITLKLSNVNDKEP